MVVRVGTLVSFLILEEMLSIFSIEDNVCCEFVIYGTYYVDVCSFYACLLESFDHKLLNFLKGFLYIYLDSHVVFIFQFVYMMYHIDWFVNIEESMHPLDKAHLVMMYDLFNVLLDSVC